MKAYLENILTELSAVSGVKTVEMWNKQPYNQTTETIVLPAVYVSASVDWQAKIGVRQQGTATVTVRIFNEVYVNNFADENANLTDYFFTAEDVLLKCVGLGLVLVREGTTDDNTNVNLYEYVFTDEVERNFETLREAHEQLITAQLFIEKNIIPD